MPALSLTTPTIQMTVPFVWRTSAASLLIAGTTPREAGTSTGAPGARNAFCMSTTTNAVFLGSRLSKVQPAALGDHPVDNLLTNGDVVHLRPA